MPRKPTTAKRKRSPRVTQSEFNPNSMDAQFATLHARLTNQTEAWNRRMDGQDELLQEICTQTKTTNGRVTKIETERKAEKAWVAGAAVVAGGIGTVIFHVASLFFR